ncbi:MAG: nitroreductase family protein [Acidimicrobiales bacterium]
MSLETLEIIRSRRVIRHFTGKSIPKKTLWNILEAARWSPTANNRRVILFVCVTDPKTLRQIKMVAPGMEDPPTALVVMCVNWSMLPVKNDRSIYIDVGLAAENMLLAAHAQGLGGWPMTSFSPEAVQVLLNTRAGFRAEMFVGLGYPAKTPANGPRNSKTRVRVEDLVQWEGFPDESGKT